MAFIGSGIHVLIATFLSSSAPARIAIFPPGIFLGFALPGIRFINFPSTYSKIENIFVNSDVKRGKERNCHGADLSNLKKERK